ncbi:MAG: hypothetical protein ACXWP4_28375, partial [Polyangiales bacterium]
VSSLLAGCSSSTHDAANADAGLDAEENLVCGVQPGYACGPLARTLASCACESGYVFVCCIDGKATPLGCWDLWEGAPCAPADVGADVEADGG